MFHLQIYGGSKVKWGYNNWGIWKYLWNINTSPFENMNIRKLESFPRSRCRRWLTCPDLFRLQSPLLSPSRSGGSFTVLLFWSEEFEPFLHKVSLKSDQECPKWLNCLKVPKVTKVPNFLNNFYKRLIKDTLYYLQTLLHFHKNVIFLPQISAHFYRKRG